MIRRGRIWLALALALLAAPAAAQFRSSAAGSSWTPPSTSYVSGATGVHAADSARLFVATAPLTFTFDRSTTLPSNWTVEILALGGDVTLTPDSHDQISGQGTGGSATLFQGARGRLTSDGAGNLTATGLDYGQIFRPVDAWPQTPNVADDEFVGGSLDTGGTRRNATGTAWTLTYGASLTVVEAKGVASFYNSSAGTFQAATQPLPSGNVNYIAKLGAFATGNNTFGIVLRESSSGKATTLAVDNNNAQVQLDTWTNQAHGTTVGSQGGTATISWIYLQVNIAGSTITYSWSPDGNGDWHTLTTRTLTTDFTSAPNQIGIGGNWGAFGVVDFFRRTS